MLSTVLYPKEKPASEGTFLASAETNIEENGPDALEKLIANKANGKQHIVVDADALEVVKRVEPIENVTAEEQLVEYPQTHLVESKKNKSAAMTAQKTALPAES